MYIVQVWIQPKYLYMQLQSWIPVNLTGNLYSILYTVYTNL